jgi:hypothetical protein
MEEKDENVVEETTQQETPIKEEPKVDDKVEKIKVKKKPSMKKLNQEDDGIIKVDLNKPPKTKENAVPESTTTTSDATIEESGDKKSSEKVVEEVRSSEEENAVQNEETPVLEEITEEVEEVEEVAEEVSEAIKESMETGEPLPENIQKLMDFMEETGGDLSDYVKLNQDYSKLEDQDLLHEYYKQTKPHLNQEEINFLMEDQFSFDEDVDEDRDIRRKKLALKEQVASAKTHLDGQKSKYYEEIKAGSKLTQEQQKAVNFFNRYNKETEETKKVADAQISTFLNKTEQVFNDKFKGFEYNVGDKKYRFNVNNAGEVKDAQSDINNFVKKFLNKNNEMSDAKGYHKSLYTAMNADAVAKHFYEQGKADAMKDSVAKSKNVNMDPRQSHGKIEAGGLKFKVLGDDSSDFKFKIKNRK